MSAAPMLYDTEDLDLRLDPVEQAIADIAIGRPWWSSTTRTGRTRAT